MKKVSKSLSKWADAFVVAAVLLLVISIIGFCINSAWTGSMFDGAIIAFIISPVFRGFSILVQNAEEQIEFRSVMDNLDKQ